MADTKQAVPAELTGIITPAEAEVQLPAVVTETFQKPGDLINRADFSPEQNAAVAQAVAVFDIKDSAAVLRFGATTQERASAYMDELLGNMKVGDAGVAGEILTEITTGVQLMNLKQVRDQMANPPAWWKKLLAYTDYVQAFIDSHKTVVGKFEGIEKKAKNLITTLSNESGKLDKLVASTIVQVNELRVLIAVGEDVLEKALAEYDQQRTIVLAEVPLNSLKLQKLLDFKASIRSFEVRLLRIKTAFVEAATTAIRQIRLTQESIKIEIQNIDEAILFDMPSIKRAILQLGALKNLQDAQAARAGYDQARADIQNVLADTTADVHEASMSSQGDALRRAEQLQTLVDKMITGAQDSQKAEAEASQRRKQAADLLIATKDQMDSASAELAKAAV